MPSIAPTTWGKFHASWKSRAIFYRSSVDEGGRKYSPARASNIASQISLKTLRGLISLWDTQMITIVAILLMQGSAKSQQAFSNWYCFAQICVFLCNIVFYQPKQAIESFTRHPNIRIEEVWSINWSKRQSFLHVWKNFNTSYRFFDWFDGSISQVLHKLDCVKFA